MNALYRILHAIDDALFDRVFQPLLDRTGCNPARLAPLVLGASFAVLVARVLLLYGDGQLAEHILDAALSLAASANLYRLYLARAARPGEPNVRRGHWIYLGLRLCMLAALHIQLLVIVAVAALPVNLAFVLLAEALSITGFYLGACEPPRPRRRRVLSPSPGLGTSAFPRA